MGYCCCCVACDKGRPGHPFGSQYESLCGLTCNTEALVDCCLPTVGPVFWLTEAAFVYLRGYMWPPMA
jgi:hypothetical protein